MHHGGAVARRGEQRGAGEAAALVADEDDAIIVGRFVGVGQGALLGLGKRRVPVGWRGPRQQRDELGTLHSGQRGERARRPIRSCLAVTAGRVRTHERKRNPVP